MKSFIFVLYSAYAIYNFYQQFVDELSLKSKPIAELHKIIIFQETFFLKLFICYFFTDLIALLVIYLTVFFVIFNSNNVNSTIQCN